MTTDRDTALREVAALISAAAVHGCQKLDPVLARVMNRLDIGYGDSPETVEAHLREALGLKACRCGITPGAPSEVIPPACPVHGIPCEHCGGTESCKENCNG